MDLIKSDKTNSLDLPKLDTMFCKTEKNEAQVAAKQGKREGGTETIVLFLLLQLRLRQLY